MNSEGHFFGGISGLVLPVPNKLAYPPEFQDKSRLAYYSSLFNSIEINSSFYKLPLARTVEKWSNEVGDNFRFTFKLWRDITHNKELLFEPDHVKLFFERINAVGNKKGCVLLQLPPSTTIDCIRQLEALLAEIHEANEGNWSIAVEFRNRSWYLDDVYQLINDHNAHVVLHDLPASSTPFPDELSDTIYLRFHGPQGGYRGSYSDDFLSEYATYISDWKNEGKIVYAYFNNTMGNAVWNLITMKKYL
jgi:uncharacterized protein YecE (DUF72 family)